MGGGLDGNESVDRCRRLSEETEPAPELATEGFLSERYDRWDDRWDVADLGPVDPKKASIGDNVA